MTELTLYGHSDDILEIRGDTKKEIHRPQNYKLLLSDGTLLNIHYEWGWNLEIETTGPKTSYEKYSMESEKAEAIAGENRSDVVKLFNQKGFQKAFVIDDLKQVIEKLVTP